VTPINTSLVTRMSNETISSRLDYQLSTKHTLVMRAEERLNYTDDAGSGGISSASALRQPGIQHERKCAEHNDHGDGSGESAGVFGARKRRGRRWRCRGGFHGGGGGDHGGGGGMRMGPPGGGHGPGGDTTEHRLNPMRAINVTNILNHFNPGGYQGVITSP
jgi:hypothetical protein